MSAGEVREDQPVRLTWANGAPTFEGDDRQLGGARLEERNGLVALVYGDLDGDVLEGYAAHGRAFFAGLHGCFALGLIDRAEKVAYLVRDAMGCHPLFYRLESDGLWFGPDLEALARAGQSQPRLDRVAGAAFLLRTSIDSEATLFSGVRRLLQGHMLHVSQGSAEARRYWRPWEPEPEPTHSFGRILRDVIDRDASGRTAVFLSGGLDSALVAAVLADVSRQRDEQPPLALALTFPDDPGDEAPMQREVASRLGLELVICAPTDLLPTNDFLNATLECGRRKVPYPPELLAALYEQLARIGRERGCTAVFDGAGGDEWLMPPPAWAADLVRRFDVRGLTTLVRAAAGYWPRTSPIDPLAGVVWRSGIRNAALSTLESGLHAAAPRTLVRVRRRRLEERVPASVAPDPDLREEVLLRMLATSAPRESEAQRRGFLDAEELSLLREDSFFLERRLGMRPVSPLLDPKVVGLLYRTPMKQLIAEGHAKALAREVLAATVGDLAWRWPRTVYANSLWRHAILSHASQAWATSGGIPRIAAAGIVDERAIAAALETAPTPPSLRGLTTLWRALSLESWLRGVDERASVPDK